MFIVTDVENVHHTSVNVILKLPDKLTKELNDFF